MATNDFYQVKLYGSIGGQQTLNVFWYLQQSGSDGADLLAAAFFTDLLPLIRAIASSAWSTQRTYVSNWNEPVDFLDDTYAPLVGTRPSIYDTPQSAMAFYQPRKRTDMRQGRKRFSGVAGADVNNGQLAAAALLTALADLATGLSDPLTTSDPANSWQQVIVRRVNVGTPTNPVYVVPPDITSDDYYTADAWQFKTAVTTQNTRKFGRGS